MCSISIPGAPGRGDSNCRSRSRVSASLGRAWSRSCSQCCRLRNFHVCEAVDVVRSRAMRTYLMKVTDLHEFSLEVGELRLESAGRLLTVMLQAAAENSQRSCWKKGLKWLTAGFALL